MFSWMPYAYVSFYTAFVANTVTPLGGTLPALCAKSSFLWSSLVFIYSNHRVKLLVNESMRIRRDKSENPQRLLKSNFTKEYIMPKNFFRNFLMFFFFYK